MSQIDKFYKWLNCQEEEYKKEVGSDIKIYWKKPLSLKELEDLDNKFFNSTEYEDE